MFNMAQPERNILSSRLHRSVHASINLDETLSVQTEHVLRNDRTVLHDRKLYQVVVKTRARKVIVHEHLNGRMSIKHNQTSLPFKVIEQRPAPLPKPPRKAKRRNWNHRRKNSPWGRDMVFPGSKPFRN